MRGNARGGGGGAGGRRATYGEVPEGRKPQRAPWLTASVAPAVPPGHERDGALRVAFPMTSSPYLTDTHRRFQARVRDFALERIVPVARALDESAEFPWESVKAMGEEGYLGVPIPRELGGMGLDTLSYILVVEELAKHDASYAITVSAHTTLGTSPILTFETREQQER